MSRIVPRLRQSPAAATTTTLSPSTITHAKRHLWPRSPFRRDDDGAGIEKQRYNRDDTSGRVAPRRPSTKSFEDLFISSLVAAGTCRRQTTRLIDAGYAIQHSRHLSIGLTRRDTTAPSRRQEPKITKEEYRKLVDFYHIPKVEKELPTKTHVPLAPRLFMTPEQEQAEEDRRRLPPSPSRRTFLPPENEEQKAIVKELSETIRLNDLGRVSLDLLWDLYQRVEAPRPRFLHDNHLRKFLQHLGFVEHWHESNARHRFFQLLDDCVAEGVSLNNHIWTTAISYAGRWMRSVTVDEVKDAIETWMRMEEEGHSADHVTLNVLFDVAVKAGRFALADTIYKEIKVRNMPLNRFFRGSLIYYAGMKRDGDDVRRAFREFVAAGEIVDTTVMNAVILSLLRSGEAAAAEHVFLKMKRLTETKFSVKSPVDWQDRKELRIELNTAAERLRAEKELHESSFFGAPFSSDERREQVQRLSPIAPDSNTYTILLQYHANTSGDAERVWQLLQEMSEQGLRPHPAAFVHILKGFRSHGGYAFSGWNHRRLEELWRVILKEMETNDPDSALPNRDSGNGHSLESASKNSLDLHTNANMSSDHVVADADEDYDWEADDAAQYGLPDQDESRSGLGQIETIIPLAGIVRPASVKYEADDFDILGAMLSDRTVLSREMMVDENAQAADHIHEPVDIDLGELRSATDPPSFLDSVSLQHLTDAALLPEGGTTLEEFRNLADHEELQPLGNPGVDMPRVAELPPKETPATGAASSFLDSLSLRHLTNAALLPEGGTPLEEAQPHAQQASHTPLKYEPLEALDTDPKVILEPSENSAEDDNFDPLPIWRRERFPTNRNDHRLYSPVSSSGPKSRSGKRYAPPPGQKPVSFSSAMALEAVRAFYQCCGRDRMLQVWDQISVLWHDASEEEMTRVGNEVGQMERHASRYEDYGRASR